MCVCIVNKYSVYISHVCVLYFVSDSSRRASMVKRHLELIARSSNFAFNSGSKQTPGAFDLLGRHGIELSKKKNTPERHEAFGKCEIVDRSSASRIHLLEQKVLAQTLRQVLPVRKETRQPGSSLDPYPTQSVVILL